MWICSQSLPLPRINKAWKRDGQNQYYIGATKTGAGKRTIGLNPALVELLIPQVASRPGKDLVFTTLEGERIIHQLYWHHYWVPAVRTAQANGLQKSPRIHDLRHRHAWRLIQDGVPLFTRPEALQVGADATWRSISGFLR